MTTTKLNILIASDNPLMMSDLARYLHFNFGNELVVTNLINKDAILEEIMEDTHIIILDKNLSIATIPNLNELIASSRPNTHVISHSINEEIKNEIEELQNRKMIDRSESQNSKRRLHYYMHRAIVYPINFLTEEFRIKKYVAIFIITFLTVGIASVIGYYLMGESTFNE